MFQDGRERWDEPHQPGSTDGGDHPGKGTKALGDDPPAPNGEGPAPLPTGTTH